MSVFNFKKGKAIGIIKGGRMSDEIIYVDNDNNNNDVLEKKRRKYYNDSDEDEYDDLFDEQIIKYKKDGIDKVVVKDEGKVLPIPKIEDNQVDHIFIAGPSGSGKSTWASMYVKQYKKLYPKNQFIIFSDVSEDEVLDKLKPMRVSIDERMYEEPLPIDEFKDSVVLFDDIDTIKDKRIKQAVKDLRDEILEKGRHNNTTVLSISHNPAGNKETKASLLESSSIVLFPGGGDDYHMSYILKNYCGINPKKINDIINIKSRWIQCHKKYPKYILHEKGAFFP